MTFLKEKEVISLHRQLYYAVWEHAHQCASCQFYRERGNAYGIYKCIERLPEARAYAPRTEGYSPFHGLLEHLLDEWSARHQIIIVHPRLMGEQALSLYQRVPDMTQAHGTICGLIRGFWFLQKSPAGHLLKVTIQSDRMREGMYFYDEEDKQRLTTLWQFPSLDAFWRWAVYEKFEGV